MHSARAMGAPANTMAPMRATSTNATRMAFLSIASASFPKRVERGARVSGDETRSETLNGHKLRFTTGRAVHHMHRSRFPR